MADDVITGLFRLIERLPELGADGEALATALRSFLEPGAVLRLETALGVSSGARARFWRAWRDEAARRLGDALLPEGAPILPRAAAVRSTLLRYGATRWRTVDRHLQGPPEYAGTIRTLTYAVLHAGAGRVPSIGALRRILAIPSDS